jgi:outer membrane protein OmpA-like peptidoglycan-associated protein
MLIRKSILIWWVAGTIPFAIATSGCATRRYVRNQIKPVSAQVAAVEASSNEKIAAVSAKHDSDMSQVNERISTTDMKVAQIASTAQQAQGTAARAMEEANSNSATIKANAAAIAKEGAPPNYQLLEKADVTFRTNSSTLSKDDKVVLDLVAQKAQTMPTAVLEIAGFTDRTGSKDKNLALSRRRAESVQRYLAMRNVPLRSIHIVGFGEEAVPPELAADVSAISNPSKADLERLARRVRIRILEPGNAAGTAARSQE